MRKKVPTSATVWRRRLSRAAAILVALVAGYLVLANALLAFVLERVDRSPSVSLTYASASTWWPGRVHLAGVELTGGHPSGWALTFDELEMDIDGGALLEGDVRVAEAHGTHARIAIDRPPDPDADRRAHAAGRGETMRLARIRPAQAAWSPALVMDALESDVVEVTLADVRLRGRMHLAVTSLTVDSAAPRVARAELRAEEATLFHRDDVVLRAGEGRAVYGGASPAASRGPSGSSVGPSGPPARWTVEIAGQVTSWKALLEPIGASLEGRAVLDARLVFPARGLDDTSSIQLRSGHLRGVLPGGHEVVLERGARLDGRGGPGGTMHWSLEAPEVVVGPGEGWLRLRDGHLEIDLVGAEPDQPPVTATQLRWRVPDLRLDVGSTRIAGAAEGELPLRDLALRAGVTLLGEGGHVSIGNVVVERGAVAAAPVDVELDVEHLAVRPGEGIALEGLVEVRGDDAAALLDIAHATPAVRLALDSLHGRPFMLESPLRWAGRAMSLPALRVDRGPFWARGAYVRQGAAEQLALLAGYGQLVVGVFRDRDAWTVEMSPPPGWLAERTARLDAPG